MDSTMEKFSSVKVMNPGTTLNTTTGNYMDATRATEDQPDEGLGIFFERPLEIFQLDWQVGSTTPVTFNPWELYMEHPSVLAKLETYKLLRTELELEFLVNGNRFYRGMIRPHYVALHTFDEFYDPSDISNAANISLSQRLHCDLNASCTKSSKLTLPFFYYKNNLDIVARDWEEMGLIDMRIINPLAHTNGATDSVSVTVLARAINFKYSVLTQARAFETSEVTLTPTTVNEGLSSQQHRFKFEKQSGEVDEANSKGFISGPASAVSKAAMAMSVIPQIKPFALATSLAANAVGGIAKLFGYSRPTVTVNPTPYRSFPTSQLATTNTPDTALKMTVDHKQELSVDPRIAGLPPDDPLSIVNIAQRESYLTTFNWSVGQAPKTLLWRCNVAPGLWGESGTDPKYYYGTATAMASMPFEFWSGSMIFRFQIIKAGVHQGRFRVVYEPSSGTSGYPDLNTIVSQIIDIQDCDEHTVTVPISQATPVVGNPTPFTNTVEDLYGTTEAVSFAAGNGRIRVFIYNELVALNSTANVDVQINVHVKMGPDFKVMAPTDEFQNFVFEKQSGDDSDEVSPTHIESKEKESMGDSQGNTDEFPLVYFGESITSFRQMLKRYNLWRRERLSARPLGVVVPQAEAVRIRGVRGHFPFYRGRVPGAIEIAFDPEGSYGYNYCNTVMLHWVTSAFLGHRGALRYKLMLQNLPKDIDNAGLDTSHAIVQRQPFGRDSSYATYAETLDPYSNPAVASLNIMKSSFTTDGPRLTGTTGSVYAHQTVNPTIEFEAPFYSPFRFSPGRFCNYTSGNFFADGWEFMYEGVGSTRTSIDFHVAAGEDFQVYMFAGLPRFVVEFAPPAPLT